jgi:hypothetical protein
LKAVHAPVPIAFRHLLVDDPTSRGHPLDIASGDDAAIPQTVAMFDGACKDVSDRLNASMRVPGKAYQILFRSVVTKVIKEKKWITLRCITESEGAAHWFVSGTAVTVAARPRTIHDFGGFPRQLHEVQYPAPGESHLARRVQRLRRLHK